MCPDIVSKRLFPSHMIQGLVPSYGFPHLPTLPLLWLWNWFYARLNQTKAVDMCCVLCKSVNITSRVWGGLLGMAPHRLESIQRFSAPTTQLLATWALHLKHEGLSFVF